MRLWQALILVGTAGCAAIAGLDEEYRTGETPQTGAGAGTATTGSGEGTTTTGGGGGGAGSGATGVGGTSAAGAPGGTGGTGATGATGGTGGAPGPVCGNDIHEPPSEECDDGNTVPWDGCSATCTIEDLDSCNAPPLIVLADGQSEVVAGDITGASDDHQQSTTTPECGPGTWPGADHVWAVLPQVSGSLYVALDASFDYHWLHLRSACPGSTDLGCDHATNAGVIDDFTVSVQSGTTYYVIVDSWSNTVGPYTLTVTLN